MTMIRIRRFAACLVALLAAAGASALAAPAAFATIVPPAPSGPATGPVTTHPVTVHTVLIGGMPGWQIALIAAAAAVLAAALQLPAEAHDTEVVWAKMPRLRAARPGTSSAVPQVPFVSVTTNACPPWFV